MFFTFFSPNKESKKIELEFEKTKIKQDKELMLERVKLESNKYFLDREKLKLERSERIDKINMEFADNITEIIKLIESRQLKKND